MSVSAQSADRLLKEGLIAVTDLPELLSAGSKGRKLHRAVGWRWIRRGVHTPAGDRVYLEAVKVGRRWMTSHGALARFLALATPGSRSHEGWRRAPRLRPETGAVLSRHGLGIS